MQNSADERTPCEHHAADDSRLRVANIAACDQPKCTQGNDDRATREERTARWEPVVIVGIESAEADADKGGKDGDGGHDPQLRDRNPLGFWI